MKRIPENSIFISILIVSLLFIIFLVFCKPIINSDDDFYALYTLAGGYGNQPTNILHYYYGWNPFLLWPIARLFALYANFNWYTFFLLILQWSSCVNLLFVFLSVFTKRFAIPVFILFFLFIETQFLLSLNYSNTSFILAISGLTSFLFRSLNVPAIFYNYKKLILPSVLILLSGLLRVHALTLGLFLSIEIIMFFAPLLNLKKIIAWLLPPCFLLLLFIVAHNRYYDKTIPNVKQEEKFRQSLFYIANHTNTSKIEDTGIVQVRNSFIESYFLYDTTFTGTSSLDNYTLNKIRNTYRHGKDLTFIQYWLLLNSRIYLVLLGIIAFAFIAWKDHRSLRKWLWIFLLNLTTLIVLLFFKVTDGMFTTFISFMFIGALLVIKNGNISTSRLSIYVLGLFLLNSAWMIIRIWKMNNANRTNIEVTRGTLAELAEHKAILFVHTNQFNDKGFYIWDTPEKYPASNLINKELLLTNSYTSLLQRHNVNDLMEQLPDNPSVLVAGQNPPLLEKYYLIEKGLNVQVVNVSGFKYLTAWAIKKRGPGEGTEATKRP